VLNLQSIVGAALVALVTGFGAGWTAQGWRQDAAESQRLEKERESQRFAQKKQAEKVSAVDASVYQRLQAADRAAAADRGDAQRLRDELARIAATTPTDTGCADVRRQRDELAGLLREGASLVEESLAAGDWLEVIAAGRRKLAEPEPQQ
jgi:hypothetical protein